MWIIFALALVSALPFLAFLRIAPLGELPSYWLSATAVLLNFTLCTFVLNGRIKWSRFHLGLGVGLVSLLLIAAVGKAPLVDLRSFLIYAVIVLMAAFLVAGISEVNSCRYYVRLAWVMVIAGVVQAITALALHYGLLPVIGRWMESPTTRITGLLAQPNLLALYLFLSFLSLCYLYATKRVSLIFGVVVGLLLGIAMAGTGSRAALIYSVAGCLLFWAIGRMYSFGGTARRPFLMFVLLWMCIPLYFLLDATLQPTMEAMGYIDRLATIDVYRDYATTGFRPSEWRKAAIMLWQHPFLGVGLGNYGVNSFWMGVKYPWAVTEGTFPTHSHNMFAQIGAEFGFGGLILLCIGFFFLIKRIVYAERSAEWCLASAACIAFFINAMVEYALWDLHFAVLAILFIVPMFGGFNYCRLNKFVLAVMVLGVGGAWGIVSLSMSDVYRKAIRYSAGVYSEFEMYDLKVAGDDSFLGRNMELLFAINVLPRSEDLKYYDDLTMRLMTWQPVNIVLFRRMQVAALKGDETEVSRMAYAMARFYPKDVPKFCRLLSNESGGASETIRRALEAQDVPPNYRLSKQNSH